MVNNHVGRYLNLLITFGFSLFLIFQNQRTTKSEFLPKINKSEPHNCPFWLPISLRPQKDPPGIWFWWLIMWPSPNFGEGSSHIRSTSFEFLQPPWSWTPLLKNCPDNWRGLVQLLIFARNRSRTNGTHRKRYVCLSKQSVGSFGILSNLVAVVAVVSF